MIKRIIILVLFLQQCAVAQNLIPNPGFEEHNDYIVFQWKQPAIPYYHFQFIYDSLSLPHSGTCLNGICLRTNYENEYLQVKLKEKLKKGQEYYVRMFVRCPDVREEKVEHIDWLFSEKEPQANDIQAYLAELPQLKFYLPKDSSNNEWMSLENKYTADGTEAFLKIGRFVPEEEIMMIRKKRAEMDASYAKLKAKSSKKRNAKEEEEFRKQINELTKKRKGPVNPARTQFLFDDLCLCPIQADGTFQLDEPTAIPEIGVTVKMDNIFFETGKYQLLEISFEELNKLVEMMKGSKTLEIKVKGHTDNVGDKIENIKLSEQRAKTVVDYLILKGIQPERLSYKGYGGAFPVANNKTEEGRAMNRRVEFTIQKK